MFQFMFMLMVQLLVKFRFFIQELWERKSLQILYECWRRAYHALLAQLFIFYGIRVAHLYSFLCCVFVLFCLHPVSCVPNVVSVFGVSIPDCLFILQDSFSRQYLVTLYLHVDWCVLQETVIIYPGTVWIFNTRVDPLVLLTVNYFNLSY
jgi:hypothetical protein